jgi:hypothetical protein
MRYLTILLALLPSLSYAAVVTVTVYAHDTFQLYASTDAGAIGHPKSLVASAVDNNRDPDYRVTDAMTFDIPLSWTVPTYIGINADLARPRNPNDRGGVAFFDVSVSRDFRLLATPDGSWVQLNDPWQEPRRIVGNGDEFFAGIVVVPEPTTLAFTALGLLALCGSTLARRARCSR